MKEEHINLINNLINNDSKLLLKFLEQASLFLNDTCRIVFGYENKNGNTVFLPSVLPLTIEDNPDKLTTYEMYVFSNFVNDCIEVIDLITNKNVKYNDLKSKYDNFKNFLVINYDTICNYQLKTNVKELKN